MGFKTTKCKSNARRKKYNDLIVWSQFSYESQVCRIINEMTLIFDDEPHIFYLTLGTKALAASQGHVVHYLSCPPK